MSPNHSTLLKIAALLSDQTYHDGTSMGQQLHISRAAVWKAVKKLIQYGVAIKSVKGKGYILEEPFLLLDTKQIQRQLPPAYTQLMIICSKPMIPLNR
jgi:BirA family transcriptional regulator, biotin operon repressor / biotin---[acetyl-CoA-carboxylase] ligase